MTALLPAPVDNGLFPAAVFCRRGRRRLTGEDEVEEDSAGEGIGELAMDSMLLVSDNARVDSDALLSAAGVSISLIRENVPDSAAARLRVIRCVSIGFE